MSFTTIAFRNIPKRKLRNSLTILAIVLGVSLIVGVNIAFDSVYGQFGDTINQAIGKVDLSIRSDLNLPFNQTVLDTVSQTSGVENAYARLTGLGNVSGPPGWVSTTLVGVNTVSDYDYLDPAATNVTGQIQLPVNSSDAIVDDRLNFTVGQQLTINFQIGFFPTYQSDNYTLEVVGFFHASEIEKQYSGVIGYTGYRIYVDLAKAQAMLNCTDQINSISIKLTDSKNPAPVVNSLSSQLGSDYIINPVKQSLLNIVSNATSGLQSGFQIMSVMALCVAIVIVLNTMYMNIGERTHEIGILRSQGASKRQVFWIFFSESLILGVIGVAIGLVLGLFITDMFRYLTSKIFEPFSPGITFTFSFPATTIQHLILGAAAGLLTVMVGGLLPSLSACQTEIINTLRPSMRKPGKQRTSLKLILVGIPFTIFGALIYVWYDWFAQYGIGLYMVSAVAPIAMIGVTLLASGLLRSGGPVIEKSLFAFGKTKKVISRNVERNLLRSTICFALIGMSLSLVVVMNGAQTGTVEGVKSVIRSFSSSDLTILSDGIVTKSFTDNITSFSTVNASTPVLVVPDQTIMQNVAASSPLNSSSTLLAIDPDSYSKVMSMTFSSDTPADAFTRLKDSGTIILTSPLAKSLNVTVGDEVKIRVLTYIGIYPVLAWQDFTVVGVAEGAWLDIMSFGNFMLSEASYISYNSVNITCPTHTDYFDSANLFFVKVNANADIAQTKSNILNSYGDEYQLSITTYDDAVQRVESSIDQIFYILYSVVAIAVANSGIGVAAIMIMNVSERRREIGIYRSQGMSKSQVVTLIIGEAAFLGFVGFVMGAILGLMFSRVTVSYMRVAGFPMAFTVPYEAMIVIFVLALLVSVVSAVYPANKASNQNIVDSIRS